MLRPTQTPHAILYFLAVWVRVSSAATSFFPNSTVMSSATSTWSYNTAPMSTTYVTGEDYRYGPWGNATGLVKPIWTTPPGAVEMCERNMSDGSYIHTTLCVLCDGAQQVCDRPGMPVYKGALGPRTMLVEQNPYRKVNQYGYTNNVGTECVASWSNSFMSWLWTAPMTPQAYLPDVLLCFSNWKQVQGTPQTPYLCNDVNAAHTPYVISENFPFTAGPDCCGECTLRAGEVQVCTYRHQVLSAPRDLN